MAAALVTLAEFDTFLGGAVAAENTLRQKLLDDIETWFLVECGRAATPFAAAATGRTEKLRGTGSDVLHLDYPISDVTTIKLGWDTADPDEQLDPDDKTEVIWEVGKHRITRVDGGRWGVFGLPAYCHITYDTQAELPKDAAMAVLRVAAAMYRQRGAEDAGNETIGGQSVNLAAIGEEQVWRDAVANHKRVSL